VLLDHPIDRVAASPANADDLHTGVLRGVLLELEDHGGEDSRKWKILQTDGGITRRPSRMSRAGIKCWGEYNADYSLAH